MSGTWRDAGFRILSLFTLNLKLVEFEALVPRDYLEMLRVGLGELLAPESSLQDRLSVNRHAIFPTCLLPFPMSSISEIARICGEGLTSFYESRPGTCIKMCSRALEYDRFQHHGGLRTWVFKIVKASFFVRFQKRSVHPSPQENVLWILWDETEIKVWLRQRHY